MHGFAVVAAAMLAPAIMLMSPVPAQANTTSDAKLLVQELPGSNRHLQDLAPGDSTEWAAQVTNNAGTPTAIRISVRATGADQLINDPVEGLQLSVDLCPALLTTDTTAHGASVFTCEADEIRLDALPAAQLASNPEGLTTRSQISPGESVSVRIRMNMPALAGNALENTQGELHIDVVAAETPETPETPHAPPVPPPGGPEVPDQPGTVPGHDGVTPENPVDSGSGPGSELVSGSGTGTGTGAGLEAGSNLAVTGRDFMAALTGALVTTVAGILLIAAARRRQRALNNEAA